MLTQQVLYRNKNIFVNATFSILQYLNDGIGTPCAGHVSAIPNPNFFLNADESRMVENFGFESPIGSKYHVKTKKTQKL